MAKLTRSRTRLKPVCHWCKIDLEDDTPYRTDMKGIEPIGSVGWVICSPQCPARPSSARVWKREIPTWVRDLVVAST